jgi:hypothetical protein
MKTINKIDEKGRVKGIEFLLGEPSQVDSHGISYAYAREQYQDMGDVMGLDRNFPGKLCKEYEVRYNK